MLKIKKRFSIITKVENDEMLSDYLELGTDATIEREHYTECSWTEDGDVLITLDCTIDADKFDDLVEGLKKLFKDQKAIVAY